MSKPSRFIRLSAAALLGCGLLSSAFAADNLQKLGFINTERVYMESRQAQGIQKALEKEFSGRQKALQKLLNDAENTNRQVVSGKLQGAEQDAAVQRLAEIERQYRLQQAKLAEEYNLRRNEEFAALQQSANRVIVDLAKKEGYDLIIQDAIYVNSRFDITDSVIKALNAQ